MSLTLEEIRTEIHRMQRIQRAGVPSEPEARGLCLALMLQSTVDKLIPEVDRLKQRNAELEAKLRMLVVSPDPQEVF